MHNFFNTEDFIAKHVTLRSESLFDQDLQAFHQFFYKEIHDRSVLVIGGAGTIGSSFIKALLQFKPRKLVIVDINENGLTELIRDLRSTKDLGLPEDIRTYPIDLGTEVFKKLFYNEAPFDIVANFAAHKHVRSEKDVYSIEAMIENNVLKAKLLLDMLSEYPPNHFFCVSTDKAANPVNIMGASKKLMEEVILAYCERFKITTARFANVAFSNGSLLDGFLQRMYRRQPLACPSDVKRFFVSPKESGQICLSACILGEAGDIFFPKLNEDQMVNFADIVQPFLNEMGYSIKKCDTAIEAKEESIQTIDNKMYPVYFFDSNTSGEKLYEEFYTDQEILDMNKFNSLGVIKNAKRRSIEELDILVENVRKLFSIPTHKADVVELLKSLLPGFNHVETGFHLDQKM